jgi:hypothetical protein
LLGSTNAQGEDIATMPSSAAAMDVHGHEWQMSSELWSYPSTLNFVNWVKRSGPRQRLMLAKISRQKHQFLDPQFQALSQRGDLKR